MSARSGLVGKKSSRPYLGPSEAIFSIDRKNPKNVKILPIFLGGPMSRGHGQAPVLFLVKHLLYRGQAPTSIEKSYLSRAPGLDLCLCDTGNFAAPSRRVLATYLIPGSVGRGVRLGSENSSGAGGAGVGGVWKSGNLEIWEFGDLGAWKSRNLEIWGPGNPEIWGRQNQKNKNYQNSNPFCPKCRQGLE